MSSGKVELLNRHAGVVGLQDDEELSLKKLSIWIGFVAFLLAFGYCVLGVIMTAWISATPGQHDLGMLETRAYLWIGGALVFLCISGALVYFGLLKKSGESSTLQPGKRGPE